MIPSCDVSSILISFALRWNDFFANSVRWNCGKINYRVQRMLVWFDDSRLIGCWNSLESILIRIYVQCAQCGYKFFGCQLLSNDKAIRSNQKLLFLTLLFIWYDSNRNRLNFLVIFRIYFIELQWKIRIKFSTEILKTIHGNDWQ